MAPKDPYVALNAMQLPVNANNDFFTGQSRLLQLLHTGLNRLRAQAAITMFACLRPTPSRSRPPPHQHDHNHTHRHHSPLADVPSPRTPSPSRTS